MKIFHTESPYYSILSVGRNAVKLLSIEAEVDCTCNIEPFGWEPLESGGRNCAGLSCPPQLHFLLLPVGCPAQSVVDKEERPPPFSVIARKGGKKESTAWAQLLKAPVRLQQRNRKASDWRSLVARRVKDLALSLLWLRSLLYHKVVPWPQNFHMPWMWPKKKKKKREREKGKRKASDNSWRSLCGYWYPAALSHPLSLRILTTPPVKVLLPLSFYREIPMSEKPSNCLTSKQQNLCDRPFYQAAFLMVSLSSP